jgi:hypothetical protein
MTDQTLADFVIAQLGQGGERDDILFALCEKAQMSWPEAEAFFDEVARSHHREITRRKSTLLLMISTLILVEGVGQTLWALSPLLDILGPFLARYRGDAPLWAALAAFPAALYLYGGALLLGLLTTLVAVVSIIRLVKHLDER